MNRAPDRLNPLHGLTLCVQKGLVLFCTVEARRNAWRGDPGAISPGMASPALRAILQQLVSAPPHPAALGFQLGTIDDDGVTLALPWREDLVGDAASGVLAGGVISALLDHACGMAVWTAMDAYQPIATLDMRIDYLRAAEPGKTVFARAGTFRLSRSVAFVRGIAHDGDPEDPVAAVQAAFMLNSDAGRKAGANLKGELA